MESFPFLLTNLFRFLLEVPLMVLHVIYHPLGLIHLDFSLECLLLDMSPPRIAAKDGKLVPRIIPEFFPATIPDFPETVLLDDQFSSQGFQPDGRTTGSLNEPDQTMSGPVPSIFCIPEFRPRLHGMVDLAPPHFGTEDLRHRFKIPKDWWPFQ